MTQINVYEAKTHLSRLIERARSGEEIVIARAGTPLVRLVAIERPIARRKLGTLADKIAFSPDWDSDDTNTAIAALFVGADD